MEDLLSDEEDLSGKVSGTGWNIEYIPTINENAKAYHKLVD